MSRLITISEGEFYHVYNRGIEKRKIFMDEKDYKRFIALLYLCNGKKKVHLSDLKNLTLPELFSVDVGAPIVSIGAYVLMTNHFHLLLREITKGGVSVFMQKLTTAYTMYFNKKNSRKGALFEGTFKAEHANNDYYLKYLYAYIHLNPIAIVDGGWKNKKIKDMKKASNFLHRYTYSSFSEYQGILRPESVIVRKSDFPEYFENTKDFDVMISEWMNYEQ